MKITVIEAWLWSRIKHRWRH